MKLPKALQQHVNRFLMKPREHYAYTHPNLPASYYGSRASRSSTMKFIIAAIGSVEDQGSRQEDKWSIDAVSASWVKMKRYGVQFSTCLKVVVRKDDLLSYLMFGHMDRNTWCGDVVHGGHMF